MPMAAVACLSLEQATHESELAIAAMTRK